MKPSAKTWAAAVLLAAAASVVAVCGPGAPEIDAEQASSGAPVVGRPDPVEPSAGQPSLRGGGGPTAPAAPERALDRPATSSAADRIQVTASIAGIVRRAGGTPVDGGIVHLQRAGQSYESEPIRVGGGFAFYDVPANLGPEPALHVRAEDGATATFAAGGTPPLPADWTRRKDLVLVMPPKQAMYLAVLWADGSPAEDFHFFVSHSERLLGSGMRIHGDGRVRLPQAASSAPWTHYGVAWSASAGPGQFVAVVPAAAARDGVLRLERPPPALRRAVVVRRDGRRWTSGRLAVRVGEQTRPVIPDADGSFCVRLSPPDAPYEVLHVPLTGAPEPLRPLAPDAEGSDVWEWRRAPLATTTLRFLQGAPSDRPWTRFRGAIGPLAVRVDADEPLSPVEVAPGVHRLVGDWEFGDAPSWHATTEISVSGDVGEVVAVRPPHAVPAEGSVRLRLARIRLALPDGRVPPVVDVFRPSPDPGATPRAIFPSWHEERFWSGTSGFERVVRSTATADGEHRFWLHEDGRPFFLVLDGMVAQQAFGPFVAHASGDFEATLRFERFARPALRLIDTKGQPVAGCEVCVRPVGFPPPGTSQRSTAAGYVMGAAGAGSSNVFLVSDGVSADGTPIRTFDVVARGVHTKDDTTSLDVVVPDEVLSGRATKSGGR